MMPLTKFEIMLKRKMGLDIRSIGRPAFERALQERRSNCGLRDLNEYWLLLQMSEKEQLQLIEAVVVPETWFFRHHEAFAELVRLQPQRPINANHPLRILSLPCSTGEEPYSIAMALLDAGIAPQHFHIDAIDISAQSLYIARQAVYGKHSFRGNVTTCRSRHFALNDQGYALSENVRQQVRFIEGNLFAADLLCGSPLYDIVFCRNLLIYFDRPTQHQAIAILTDRLAPEGLLFVGPAETSLMAQHPLTSLGAPMTFAFRRSTPKQTATAKQSSTQTAPLSSQLPLALYATAPRFGALGASQPTTNPALGATLLPVQQENLEAVQLLADQGKLIEAESLCEQLIHRHGASAAAYYLMGVIYDAAGRKEPASNCYRKALYLEPNHTDAMAHLAALLQMQGDVAGAKRLQQRARRSVEQNPVDERPASCKQL